jgi:hypothetical protein
MLPWWFVIVYFIVLLSPFVALQTYYHFENKNWNDIDTIDGYLYQEHKTKRKRRYQKIFTRPNVNWLNYRTDELK